MMEKIVYRGERAKNMESSFTEREKSSTTLTRSEERSRIRPTDLQEATRTSQMSL